MLAKPTTLSQTNSPASEIQPEWLELSGALLIRKFYQFCQRLFRGLAYSYLLLLVLVTGSFHFLGQANLTSAALMYLPPWIWIAPVIFLIPLGLILDRKSSFAMLVAAGMFTLGHLGFQWRNPPPPGELDALKTLRILTWNRGQSKGSSLQELKNQIHPDIILLQEAGGTSRYYKDNPRYVEFAHVSEIGEFMLLSRWPVLSSELVAFFQKRSRHGQPQAAAARFAVDVNGTECVIYSVHLPTPRDSLNSYKRGAFLWGILGIPGTPWEAKKQFYQQFWDDQIAVARAVQQRATQERFPLLIAGDFNTPAFGPIYDLFADSFSDAHTKAGDGFGFTFPGVTNNPLGLFQPWLRLDQIFASSHLQALSCAPQQMPAQHLPVFAVFTVPPSVAPKPAEEK
jgi:endonuclease/exonuclease/phosphatase (EEP) superfamily protein YafD